MKMTKYLDAGIRDMKGNPITAWIQSQEEGTYVACKPFCDAMGMAWQVQARKLAGNPKFNCHLMVMVGSDGKYREMLSLPAEQLADWVHSINANKVAEAKDKFLGFFYQPPM